MTGTLLDARTVTVNASAAAQAWINAFHATGQDEERWALYRTMGVEFYTTGVQFIATSGTLLFRTWVPIDGADWPTDNKTPERAVVVMDGNHFALAFIKQLLSAAKHFEVAELSLAIEDAPEQDEDETPPLGAEFSQQVLTLRAFGQQLHCRLFEDKYVNWRALDFGIDQAERVDGMTVSIAMLAAVGKLKGVGAVDLTFTGDAKNILMTGIAGGFRGVMAPMRRKEKETPAPEDDDDTQVDALTEVEMKSGGALKDAKVKVDGRWVPATKENVAKALGAKKGGRDRAAGRDD